MSKVTQNKKCAEAIADGFLALGVKFRTRGILAGMIENALDEAARAEAAALREALDRAAFRVQMMVDRLPPDEDGKTYKALCQTYVDDMRTALQEPDA